MHPTAGSVRGVSNDQRRCVDPIAPRFTTQLRGLQDDERHRVRTPGGDVSVMGRARSSASGTDDQHLGWPELRLRQVGKGEPDEDYRTCCRWAHAASSSGRFQSLLNADSVRRAVSDVAGVSSRMVTNARHAIAG